MRVSDFTVVFKWMYVGVCGVLRCMPMREGGGGAGEPQRRYRLINVVNEICIVSTGLYCV